MVWRGGICLDDVALHISIDIGMVYMALCTASRRAEQIQGMQVWLEVPAEMVKLRNVKILSTNEAAILGCEVSCLCCLACTIGCKNICTITMINYSIYYPLYIRVEAELSTAIKSSK